MKTGGEIGAFIVVDRRGSLQHHFFQATQAQRISHLPAHTSEHDIQRVVQALEYLADSRVRGRHHRISLVPTGRPP